jgi:2-polyprenyl-6-methoxyphenol hydroxylase-like FAD-dependent oxidoreductase
LSLPQPALTRLFLREALKTGNVTVHYDSELIELDDRGASVVATIHDIRAQTVSQVTGRYLVGADGGKSATRKLLGVGFPGHTWPERLIATDIMFYNHVGHIDPVYPTYQVMGTRYFTFMSPLQTPVPERRTLWRCTIATPADDERTDAELVCDEALYALFDNVLSGPRPLQVEIKQRAVYRIHQRLATTMRRGRCLLAGDAAHVNNVSFAPFLSPKAYENADI